MFTESSIEAALNIQDMVSCPAPIAIERMEKINVAPQHPSARMHVGFGGEVSYPTA